MHFKSFNKKSLASMATMTVAVLLVAGCSQSTAVKNLRTEYMNNPVGLDVAQPRFSWLMESDRRGAAQTAYEITVTADLAGKDVVWNSGKIESNRSVQALYAGKPLTAAKRYYWNVTVWDETGTAIKSKQAWFETGLMNSGWSNAKWIQKPEPKQEGPSKYTVEMKFRIDNMSAGPIFGAANRNNFYMWQINLEKDGKTFLRPHVFRGGGSTVLEEKDITGKANLKLHTPYKLRIEVDKNVARTFINDVEVDVRTNPDGSNYPFGMLGFRENGNENASFDDIRLTAEKDGKPELVIDQNFDSEPSNGEKPFAQGRWTDGQLQVGNTIAWSSGDAEGNPMFRTEFALDKAISSARIYTTGLGIYNVFINGQRVGRPDGKGGMVYDELKPEWTEYDKTLFYFTCDVTDLLKQGKNAIGAQLTPGWWMGAISRGAYGTHPLGFLAKLTVTFADGSTATVVTDPATWKTSDDSPIRVGDIYAGETYDARKESAWTSAGFDDSQWATCEENTAFKGQITAFVGPSIQIRPQLQRKPVKIIKYEGVKKGDTEFGMIDVKETSEQPKAMTVGKGQTLVYDLGQNMVGWTNIKVKGKAGTTVTIRFGEMLNDKGDPKRGDDGPGGSLYRANLRSAKATLTYTLKGDPKGETYHPSSTFFGFRFCDITATDEVEISSLTGDVIGSANEESSSFATDHPDVNKLYSNIVWGQRGNFVSVPTDCPQRDERMGWTGDIQIFGRTATYNADVAAFFHKWMRDMRDTQSPEGAFGSTSPLIWGGHGASAWAEAGLVIPWNNYIMYNDVKILHDNYAAMEKYMAFLASQATSEYRYNGGRTNYGDWVSYVHTDSRYISVCYYAYSAQIMEKAAKALGKADDATAYHALHDSIKAEFQTRYVDADGMLTQNTQTAYLLALHFDLVSDANRAKAIERLGKLIVDNGYKLNTGFVGTGTLNQTLSDVGLTDLAYDLLLQRENPSWLYSVDQGATTIWERWNSYTIDKGFGPIGMNSFNHYAYGVVGEWMFRYMAGINPDASNPGFNHIILSPLPDMRKDFPQGQKRINHCDATYGSYYGPIRSAWTINADGSISYEFTLPANTTTSLTLPLPNGKQVFEGTAPAEKAEGVVSFKSEGGKAMLELKSGKYGFVVK